MSEKKKKILLGLLVCGLMMLVAFLGWNQIQKTNHKEVEPPVVDTSIAVENLPTGGMEFLYEVSSMPYPFVRKESKGVNASGESGAMTNLPVIPSSMSQIPQRPMPSMPYEMSGGIPKMVESLSVQGILIGNGSNMAILNNGKIVREGENVGGYGMVVSIVKDGVVFESGRKLVYLSSLK